MANLPHKMPGKALFVYSMCLLSLIPIIKANPTFRSISCQKTTNTSTPDNNYLANLNILPDGSSPPDVAFTSSKSTVSNGFYKLTASNKSTVPNYQARCGNNVTKAVCKDCIDHAPIDAVQLCPRSKQVSIVYDECIVSYSNVPVDKTFVSIDCPNTTLASTGTYAQNSTYQTNLNTLFSVLSSNSGNASSGFYNFTAGSSPPDVVYGLFLCRGGVAADVCRDCVVYATEDVVKRCPGSKYVTIWYDQCLLRYSNLSIFAAADTLLWVVLANPQSVTDATRFTDVLGQVLTNVVYRASSDDSGKKFATAQANYSALQSVYGLVQCTPDLSDSDCDGCLLNGISKIPDDAN